MARITRVSTKIVRTRMAEAFLTTYGKHPEFQPHVLVTVEADGGITGFGEASPLPRFTGETAETIQFVIDHHLGPALLGGDPSDIEAAHERMERVLPHNRSAKAACDLALHDLAGKLWGVPAFRLLGGGLRDEVVCSDSIGAGSIAEMVAEVERRVAEGYRSFKLKIGLDVEKDVAMVRAVREAAGPAVRLHVDANGGYDVPTAIAAARAMQPFGIEYMEQPVPPRDIEGMAAVRRACDIPILADESLHTLEDARELVRRGAADYFGIKFIKHGGLLPAKKIAHLAEAFGVRCVVISPFETQVGVAAGLHFALSLPNAGAAHDLTSSKFFSDDPATGFRLPAAVVPAPTAPGLGVQLHLREPDA